ncbi:MAG: hydroxyethylthiazole kinase [Thermodesulfobacteriota bacterium]
MNMKAQTVALLAKVRKNAPLVHNITNYVVMNSSANILLALGASPVMAHCLAEIEEMTGIAGALVVNIGTIDESWLEAMLLAGKTANKKGIPVILDPVGSGATAFRTASVLRILDECRVSVLRGNASEVFSLTGSGVTTRGVDSSLSLADAHVEAARGMARDLGCIVAISGPADCITDGSRIFLVKNGHPLMTRVTGIGCGLSATVAAFCAVAGKDLLEATVSAFAFYGICGDMAAKIADKPGSFEVAFIDCLYSADEGEIAGMLDISEQ